MFEFTILNYFLYYQKTTKYKYLWLYFVDKKGEVHYEITNKVIE